MLDGNVLEGEIIQTEIVGPTVLAGTFTKKAASALAKKLGSGDVR